MKSIPTIHPIKTLKEILQEISDKESTLVRKTLVYVSPITKDMEYRVAYFISPAEASIWEGEMTKKYQELNITHEIFTHIVSKEVRHG